MRILSFLARARQNKKENDKKKPTPEPESGIRMALGVGIAIILSFLLTIHLLPDKVDLHVGDVSPQEIRAHRTVKYVDSIETERLRMEAANRADKVYKVVPSAAYKATESITETIEGLERARLDERSASIASKIILVKGNISIDLSDESLESLLKADDTTFKQIGAYTKQLVREILDREIRDDTNDVEKARAEFSRRIRNYIVDRGSAVAAVQMGNSVIRPNRIFDPAETNAAREREMRTVPPQYRQVFIGDVIVQKGESITPSHIEKFVALGLSHPRIDYLAVISISLLVAFMVLFVKAYLKRYHTRIFESNKLLVLLSLIVLLSVLGLKLGGTMLGLKLSGAQYGYFAMIWISTAGMLTAVLLSPQIAVLIVALLSTTSGLTLSNELRWALGALATSLVAIYAVSDIRRHSDLLRALGVLWAANLAVVWLMGTISGDTIHDLLLGSTWAVAGGLSSIGLFWLGTAALEKPFGITTHIRLLELSDTNNPILKRLLMEAPGTYSHSIFVGNIASAVAEVIGADALLVRVASYYHDVGKMKRPYFFVENQHVENAHDHLNPSLSALVIRSHTKDGVELATEYKLPSVIRELINEHHGTSLVRYFYHQAASDVGNGSEALEQQFRYEGVKPQSKEAAILMLADAVEAASRSLSKPTLGRIESMVEEVIAEKLADGQLDESELTFKDVSRIRNSFIRTLTSMLHARIEYPESPATEVKKSGANGSANRESPAGEGGSKKAGKGSSKVSSN
jgi:hypothetical protein